MSSTTNNISFTLPYGYYEYKVFNVTGYEVVQSSSDYVNLTHSILIKVSFTELLYNVTFKEEGLPNGTTWTVCINGRNYTTTSSLLSITLPYGTYEYRIFTTSNGYSPNITEGTLTGSEVISLMYKPMIITSTTTSTSANKPSVNSVTSTNSNLIIIGIIIVIIVAISVAVIFLLRKK
ncbi:hypothetical protein [Sulfurisphaera ohwakuensis]|uniref:hypothetical protein n=1 Tax=Sulfurisphaera ohwakuensis TaxID=69656 RepID=UPI0036F3B280